MKNYQKLCAEFYDLDKPFPSSDSLDFYLSYAQVAKGTILEPMCGTGRYLIPLYKKGIEIHGLDASQEMLQSCRNKCKELRINPVLYNLSLENIILPQYYSLVIIPAGSLGLITNMEKLETCIKRIYNLMLPGAKLVFEVELFIVDQSEPTIFDKRFVTRKDGTKLFITCLSNYFSDDRILYRTHRYDLIKDGVLKDSELEEFNFKYFLKDEIIRLVNNSKLDNIKIYSNYNKKLARDNEGSVIIECTKLISD